MVNIKPRQLLLSCRLVLMNLDGLQVWRRIHIMWDDDKSYLAIADIG